MILKAFSLLDTKTGIFNTPFFLPHVGQAIRACMDLGQDMNTTVGRHPADFQLVELGTFDDQSGVMVAQLPLQLGTVLSFLPEQTHFDRIDRQFAEQTRRAQAAEPSPELARQVEHARDQADRVALRNGEM